MDLYLVRAARTPWDIERRVMGNFDIPLGPEGVREVEEGLRKAAPAEARAVYSSATLPAWQTARIVAKGIGRAARKVEGLEELNLGFWQGLFESDLKRKHHKAYATWRASPVAVVPPRGEWLRDAFWRLSEALDDVLAQHGRKTSAAVVVSRFAFRIIESRLRGVQPEEFWEDEGAGFRVERFAM
jgi:broad specificity phosphatase PhoE